MIRSDHNQAEIARRVGKSEAYVSLRLPLLSLPRRSGGSLTREAQESYWLLAM
ncbi:TPA: hypothetical protein EYP44_05370 [Candidatus Bathyarchaeota archaeon]|nr:hypothetical protein [Candidatus Bathyarchaeota archaeon]